MSELREMLVESLERVFQDQCSAEQVQAADQGGFDQSLWTIIEKLGFNLAGVTEEQGGAGATLSDQVALLRLAGRYSAPIPLAETMMVGSWLLTEAGLDIPAGALATGPTTPQEALQISRTAEGYRLSGSLTRISSPDRVSRIVVLAELDQQAYVASVDPASCEVETVLNLAGETRATVSFDRVSLSEAQVAAAPAGVDSATLAQRSALARAALMTGALERALQLALDYARERKQFGRSISKFQAVQQQLAIFAAEVVAAKAMTDQAAAAMDLGPAGNAVAAAKIRAGQAAGVATRIAHQIHGAMGFTQEYPLHHATRRLWAWRDENGSERYWSHQLGLAVTAGGAENVWPMITGTL
ncbi:MAG: acyl-CoA/acyl-ACP dehydrogenase [Gammaproteobacteria bacterium]|nr:acyl-CoA/acyl-ACP dehydrogenase [Gammaproteobacteria bacterium]